jgi:hypothetical protein
MTESDAFRILFKRDKFFELTIRRNMPGNTFPFVVTLAIMNCVYRTEARTVREALQSVLQTAGMEGQRGVDRALQFPGRDRRVP